MTKLATLWAEERPRLVGITIAVFALLAAVGFTVDQSTQASVLAIVTALVSVGAGETVRAGVVPLSQVVDNAEEIPHVLTQLLDETVVEGKRLGRHVEHDARSLAYPAHVPSAPLVSKQWTRRSHIFNQGDIGACTGNAAAGWAGTDNAARAGNPKLTETTARKVYSLATSLDTIPGQWKPTDTGSSGLAAAQALVKLDYATKYTHAFDSATVLATLSHVGPVMIGIQWKTGCDTPDANGLVSWSGTVRGGHEILIDEINVEKQLVGISNSWGTTWGVKGRFYMSWADLAAALKDSGDATIPA